MKCLIHPDREAVGVCTECGGAVCEECRVDLENKNYCKKCVASIIKNKKTQERNPALAAILSFFIGGLGQIYNGQIGKGILILFTSWLIIPWIYGIFDAYAVANKINKGEIVPAAGGCATAALFIVVSFFVIIPIMGLLAAIAIPNFVKAREVAQSRMVDANLKQIDGAIQIWAIENNKSDGDVVTWENLVPDYLRTNPNVYQGSGKYTITTVGEEPTHSRE